MEPNKNKHSFINFLTRKGKKGKIETIYHKILFKLKQKKQNPTVVFNHVLTDLKPKVQMKSISRFKSVLQPMKTSRQTFMALKWLTEKATTKQLPKDQSVVNEIQNTLVKTSPSFAKKTSIYQEAQKLKFTLRRTYKKK